MALLKSKAAKLAAQTDATRLLEAGLFLSSQPSTQNTAHSLFHRLAASPAMRQKPMK
jgi:hypothetical protein